LFFTVASLKVSKVRKVFVYQWYYVTPLIVQVLVSWGSIAAEQKGELAGLN